MSLANIGNFLGGVTAGLGTVQDMTAKSQLMDIQKQQLEQGAERFKWEKAKYDENQEFIKQEVPLDTLRQQLGDAVFNPLYDAADKLGYITKTSDGMPASISIENSGKMMKFMQNNTGLGVEVAKGQYAQSLTKMEDVKNQLLKKPNDPSLIQAYQDAQSESLKAYNNFITLDKELFSATEKEKIKLQSDIIKASKTNVPDIIKIAREVYPNFDSFTPEQKRKVLLEIKEKPPSTTIRNESEGSYVLRKDAEGKEYYFYPKSGRKVYVEEGSITAKATSENLSNVNKMDKILQNTYPNWLMMKPELKDELRKRKAMELGIDISAPSGGGGKQPATGSNAEKLKKIF